MDFYLLLPTIVVILGTLFLSLPWLNLMKKKKTTSMRKEAPKLPGCRPITGHLHLLSYPLRPHRAFASLAERYGPIFMMRPGLHNTLVVSDVEIAKECFTTNDRAFATRPIGYAHKVMGYDAAMFGFSPYGLYWRETRKIATFKLLTAQKLDQLKHLRSSEVEACMKGLHGLWLKNGQCPVSVGMNQCFEEVVSNIVMRMVVGRRYLGEDASEGDVAVARAFRKASKEFNRFLAVTVAYDALPFLGWLDLKGDIRSMRKNRDEMDSIMQVWVDEHRLRRSKKRSENCEKEDQDFIDVLLAMEEEDDGGLVDLHNDFNTVIKATALNLIIAGVENTVNALVWTLSLLLKNPSVMEKAQAELDAIVGQERRLNESDIGSLTYLQAIVKETLRLYPTAPLLVPHEAMEDCTVDGCYIARGTRLVVNAWMIQRDPRLWSDPEKFWPDRFLTTNAGRDVKGQNFEIIPFGSGRRSCPGTGFALQVMHLLLAHMLHAFDWMIDPDIGHDIEEGYGVALSKLNPLNAKLKPRLPQGLYTYNM